jgi:hypothetical protein
MPRVCSGLLSSFLIASAASAVTMDWALVGNPGNPCDPQPGSCYGAVGYTYNIGTYEVTNAQYAEFLNAKASPTDPLFLYDVHMGNNPSWSSGGIRRDGTPAAIPTRRSVDGRTCPSTTCPSSTPCVSRTG